MIRFHKYKKGPKSTKKFFKTSRFICLKFIDINCIKFKKHLSGKKVTYLLTYEKSFYDENIGFTKLIKVLKPR